MRSRFALCLLLALGIPGRPASAGKAEQLHRDYTLSSLPYRSATGDRAADLAVCGPGLALVPLGGGVQLAGWGGWLIEPRGEPAIQVECGPEGVFFLVSETGKLVRLDGGATGKRRVLLQLPSPGFRVRATPGGALWAFGQTPKRGWEIWHFAPDGQRQAFDAPGPLADLVPVGERSLLAVVGDRLTMRRTDGRWATLARLPVAPGALEGLALAADGSVFLSDGDGVVRLRERGTVERIAGGIHGPLAAVGDTLFVLSAERSRVFRLHHKKPKPASGRKTRAGTH